MHKWMRAFTLIELTVVLLIISLSLAVVCPRFTAGSDQLSLLRSSVNRIASVAEYASQQAACTRFMYFLNLDTQEGTYWVTSQKPDGQKVPVTDALSLKGQLPDGVKFADVKIQGMNTHSQGILVIRLSPQGWADPAEIILTCSTGETMSIMIDELSGQIETCMTERLI